MAERASFRLVVTEWLIALLFILHLSSTGVLGPPQVPAMFVFGDSLVDDGNNNYLSSLAKSNYPPYGIDFYQGPSGRFSNGRTTIDVLGELLGLPYLPAYADPHTAGTRILSGVNYASAAGGILDETGRNLGQHFSLRQQVTNFENTLNQLHNQMDELKMNLSDYLAKSIVVMVLGSNDYINNYLVPSMYTTSYIYNPQDFATLLIDRYSKQILALYNLGLRKFLLAGLGPLGCIPNQLATGLFSSGRCVSYVNEIVGLFNVKLRSLVDQLNANHRGVIFVYGDTYGAFTDILNNPTAYGFNNTDEGCCGLGRNQGQITRLPLLIPCANRNQYIFWDAFHPTQAVNAILAHRAYMGHPSDCYPINVQQMAQL